jgi:hypothetical protein
MIKRRLRGTRDRFAFYGVGGIWMCSCLGCGSGLYLWQGKRLDRYDFVSHLFNQHSVLTVAYSLSTKLFMVIPR